jgi:hypothetical protein
MIPLINNANALESTSNNTIQCLANDVVMTEGTIRAVQRKKVMDGNKKDGVEGYRSPCLYVANVALYHMSYNPFVDF